MIVSGRESCEQRALKITLAAFLSSRCPIERSAALATSAHTR